MEEIARKKAEKKEAEEEAVKKQAEEDEIIRQQKIQRAKEAYKRSMGSVSNEDEKTQGLTLEKKVTQKAGKKKPVKRKSVKQLKKAEKKEMAKTALPKEMIKVRIFCLLLAPSSAFYKSTKGKQYIHTNTITVG